MYYTATIVSMAGIGTTSAQAAIWTSAVITAFYLAACGLGVLLVERLGRRKLLLTSLVGVILSLVLIAVGFQLADIHSPKAEAGNSNSSCGSLTSCSECMREDGCGFCYSGTRWFKSLLKNRESAPRFCIFGSRSYLYSKALIKANTN